MDVFSNLQNEANMSEKKLIRNANFNAFFNDKFKYENIVQNFVKFELQKPLNF